MVWVQLEMNINSDIDTKETVSSWFSIIQELVN